MSLLFNFITNLFGIYVPNMTQPIKNEDRKFGADTQYYVGSVIDGKGNKVLALFTYDQIVSALVRAEKNKEDLQ